MQAQRLSRTLRRFLCGNDVKLEKSTPNISSQSHNSTIYCNMEWNPAVWMQEQTHCTRGFVSYFVKLCMYQVPVLHTLSSKKVTDFETPWVHVCKTSNYTQYLSKRAHNSAKHQYTCKISLSIELKHFAPVRERLSWQKSHEVTHSGMPRCESSGTCWNSHSDSVTTWTKM